MSRNDRNGIIAIDIGSSKVAALMFTADDSANPIIEGYGIVASEGVKKGLITDIEAASSAISAAVSIW
jgi:cell division protein FtsA